MPEFEEALVPTPYRAGALISSGPRSVRLLCSVRSSRDKDDVIRLIDLEGRSRGEIKPDIKGGIISLSWGPDGRQIAFEATSRTSTQVTLWVAEVKTGRVQELVKNVSPYPPNWQP